MKMFCDNSEYKVELLDSIRLRLGEDTEELFSDELIQSLMDDYAQVICNETFYKTLPRQFYPYLISAVVESCQRLGHDGMYSRSELGVNTTYSYKDIEESIRQKLRGKRNPRAFLGR